MTRFRILAIWLLAFSMPMLAGELKVGDELPVLRLEDQNGKPHTVDGSVHHLVFAPDRASSQMVTDTFKGQTAASLQGRGIAYVADIKGMPSLVTSLFALPKMRKQPYPILLGKKAADTAGLPRQAERVTVIDLNNGRIASITCLTNATELRQGLGFDRMAASPGNANDSPSGF